VDKRGIGMDPQPNNDTPTHEAAAAQPFDPSDAYLDAFLTRHRYLVTKENRNGLRQNLAAEKKVFATEDECTKYLDSVFAK
jgi:hypothetical protein